MQQQTKEYRHQQQRETLMFSQLPVYGEMTQTTQWIVEHFYVSSSITTGMSNVQVMTLQY